MRMRKTVLALFITGLLNLVLIAQGFPGDFRYTSITMNRLQKELRRMERDPLPYIQARPNENNFFEWHYIITGPPNTNFEGGEYHGKLVLPFEYPYQPPSIYMTTPNGRFVTGERLCLSISDYHPETWNPMWGIGSILNGLLIIMQEPPYGAIGDIAHWCPRQIRKYAKNSKLWNRTNNREFKNTFADLLNDGDTFPSDADGSSSSIISNHETTVGLPKSWFDPLVKMYFFYRN